MVLWVVSRASEKEVFSDLKTEVFSDRGPNGLLDVCFHPKFRENRKYYLYIQVLEEGEVTTRIVEKIFNDDFTADSGSEARELIEIKRIAEDHSGGCLDFGPDGFLYFAMGDTGPHHDPNGHAQNPGLLLGKMMRIDVDLQDAGREYAIPQDNSFVGRENFRLEIWDFGSGTPGAFA